MFHSGLIASLGARLLLTRAWLRTPGAEAVDDGADMVLGAEVIRFAGLRRDVADVDDGASRPANRLDHAVDHEFGRTLV